MICVGQTNVYSEIWMRLTKTLWSANLYFVWTLVSFPLNNCHNFELKYDVLFLHRTQFVVNAHWFYFLNQNKANDNLYFTVNSRIYCRGYFKTLKIAYWLSLRYWIVLLLPHIRQLDATATYFPNSTCIINWGITNSIQLGNTKLYLIDWKI